MKKFIASQWFVDIVSGLIAGGILAWALVALGFFR